MDKYLTVSLHGRDMNEFETIYEKWHEYAKGRDVPSLINLYAEDAVFESPLVPAILDQDSGVLRGRQEIVRFLEEGTKRRPNDLVRWHRTGKYFINGDTLIWEYPRETPEGDQIDILEVMQISGYKIMNHRIYWGWFGCSLLIESALKKNPS
ncbi:nuclear transport factor 2 family protein [Vibrio sp. PP-XX7]